MLVISFIYTKCMTYYVSLSIQYVNTRLILIGMNLYVINELGEGEQTNSTFSFQRS